MYIVIMYIPTYLLYTTVLHCTQSGRAQRYEYATRRHEFVIAMLIYSRLHHVFQFVHSHIGIKYIYHIDYNNIVTSMQSLRRLYNIMYLPIALMHYRNIIYFYMRVCVNTYNVMLRLTPMQWKIGQLWWKEDQLWRKKKTTLMKKR